MGYGLRVMEFAGCSRRSIERKLFLSPPFPKFFYPQHQNQPQTNRQQTLLTDVKTQVFHPGFTPQKPTMVGVGREMVGSWQGVKRELAAIEVRANIYFFCLRMEKVSYLCILN
jgi:hypothetical protein